MAQMAVVSTQHDHTRMCVHAVTTQMCPQQRSALKLGSWAWGRLLLLPGCSRGRGFGAGPQSCRSGAGGEARTSRCNPDSSPSRRFIQRAALCLETNDNSGETLWGLVIVQVKWQKSGESRGQAMGSKRSQAAGPVTGLRKDARTAEPICVASFGSSGQAARVGLGLTNVSRRTRTAWSGARREPLPLLCLSEGRGGNKPVTSRPSA